MLRIMFQPPFQSSRRVNIIPYGSAGEAAPARGQPFAGSVDPVGDEQATTGLMSALRNMSHSSMMGKRAVYFGQICPWDQTP